MKKVKRKNVKIDHGTSWKKIEEAPILCAPSQLVVVGDTVKRKTYILSRNETEEPRAYPATVIYVHPRGRFHVVEFRFPNGAVIRESFLGVER